MFIIGVSFLCLPFIRDDRPIIANYSPPSR
jgi:hypothetical protein